MNIVEVPKGEVLVKQEILDDLMDKSYFLDALEIAGVVNWEGYPSAVKVYKNTLEMLEEEREYREQ